MTSESELVEEATIILVGGLCFLELGFTEDWRDILDEDEDVDVDALVVVESVGARFFLFFLTRLSTTVADNGFVGKGDSAKEDKLVTKEVAMGNPVEGEASTAESFGILCNASVNEIEAKGVDVLGEDK